MFLVHYMMELTVLTILSLCLPVWSDVKVVQPYKVVSTNGTAQIQCTIHPQPSYNHIQPSYDQNLPYPYPDPEELRVSLLKGLHGNHELCSSIINFSEQKEAIVENKGEVHCFSSLREGTVEVTVIGLKPSDTDMYRCGIEVFYPPPYLQIIGNGTLIHVLDTSDCPVQGSQRQTANQDDVEEEDAEGNQMMGPVSVPVGVLMILVIFVLVIIICLQVLHCEQWKRETVTHVPGAFHKVDAVAFSCEDMA